MFTKYLTYFHYQQSVLAWARQLAYQSKDITFVYPWQPLPPQIRSNVLVLFERTATIDKFKSIYSNDFVTILEKPPDDARKIRFGVPEKLFSELLTYVRATAEAYFAAAELPSITDHVSEEHQPYLKDDFTVDVGVWVAGHLRGSRLSATNVVDDPIQAATLNALNDTRFKVVTSSELQQARFEITLIPDLWITVTRNELHHTHAPTTLATHCYIAGKARSIYVPMVANSTKHSVARTYYTALAQKAQAKDTTDLTYKHAPAYCAIETHKQSSVLVLQGPYPKNVNTAVTQETAAELKDHLLTNLDEDGFAPIVRRASGTTDNILDAVRLSFVLCALAEYQAVTKDTSFVPELQKIHRFLERILTSGSLSHIDSLATKIYCNQAQHLVPELPSFTLPNDTFEQLVASPLMQLQWLKQALPNRTFRPEEAMHFRAQIKNTFDTWNQKHSQLSPVGFADLIPLLEWSNLTGPLQSFTTTLRTQQRSDGTFANMSQAYQRGVSKLAEAAAHSQSTHDIARKSLRFIRQMQYTDDSMYHLPARLWKYFRHGFRHDAWNRDLWLDGSAHALLLEVRLEYFASYRAHQQKCLSGYISALAESDS